MSRPGGGVLLANLIARPTAYWAMSRWLRNFAYRSGLDIRIFFLAGGLALAVAFVTVGYQALKASNTDPVTTLKYEKGTQGGFTPAGKKFQPPKPFYVICVLIYVNYIKRGRP